MSDNMDPAVLYFPQLGQGARRIAECAFLGDFGGSAQDRGPRHDRNPVFLFSSGGDIGPMDLPHGALKSIPKLVWRGSYGRCEAMSCKFILHGEAPFLVFLAVTLRTLESRSAANNTVHSPVSPSSCPTQKAKTI